MKYPKDFYYLKCFTACHQKLKWENLKIYIYCVYFLLLFAVISLCTAYNRGPQPVKQDTTTPSTLPPPTLPPCRPKGGPTMSDVKRHMLITHNKVKVTGNDVIGRTYDWTPEVNCTGEMVLFITDLCFEFYSVPIL
jgi:hypothetical protein